MPTAHNGLIAGSNPVAPTNATVARRKRNELLPRMGAGSIPAGGAIRVRDAMADMGSSNLPSCRFESYRTHQYLLCSEYTSVAGMVDARRLKRLHLQVRVLPDVPVDKGRRIVYTTRMLGQTSRGVQGT